MKYNPATVGTLLGLMLGGIHPGHSGQVLQCRLRYFDPVRRRAGIPDDIAALVTELTADGVKVTLVNVNQSETRTLIVQAGGYAEHRFTRVRTGEHEMVLASPYLTVRLAPGAGAELDFEMERFANQPVMDVPWDRGWVTVKAAEKP